MVKCKCNKFMFIMTVSDRSYQINSYVALHHEQFICKSNYDYSLQLIKLSYLV